MRADFSNINSALNVDWERFQADRTLRKRLLLGTTIASSNSPYSLKKYRADLLWGPLLAIGAAAFAVEIPFFFLGNASGHDFEFHLYTWLEVLAQWKQGIIFPRWAALAHFGYGEPRFIFYPPASWLLGAALSKIVPWTIVPGVYIWIALVAAGSSMFALARRWLDRRDATFAALLYAVNPYHLVIVYWRSSFAELLAACLVPLLLLFVLEAAEGRNVIVPLGIVLGCVWLTNAPAAVMIHYSLALLVVLLAWQRRSLRLLRIAAAAVALGACLSAFYLLPAIYEQRWVEIAQAVSPGSRPADNFLFIHTTDPDHDTFNHIISWVAVFEMAVTALAVFTSQAWRKTKQELWSILPTWGVACAVLMFPMSLFLWEILPKMRFMQFPWRWLLCLSVIFTIFVTVGMRKWLQVTVFILSILTIVAVWHRLQAPWWDNAADLREMQDNMETGTGYEGTDEYAPSGADPSIIDKDVRNVTVEGPAHAAIRVQAWGAESKNFTAEMSAPDQLMLRLFPYPAWRVAVNGHLVRSGARAGSGQMLVPVAAGMNRVEVTFVRTWDRTAGGWISGVTGFALLVWGFRKQFSAR